MKKLALFFFLSMISLNAFAYSQSVRVASIDENVFDIELCGSSNREEDVNYLYCHSMLSKKLNKKEIASVRSSFYWRNWVSLDSLGDGHRYSDNEMNSMIVDLSKIISRLEYNRKKRDGTLYNDYIGLD